MYEENKEIIGEHYRNLNRITGIKPININHHQQILNNLEPIKKIMTHTRLLIAVIETDKEKHRDDDFKKAYQDLKNGTENATFPVHI